MRTNKIVAAGAVVAITVGSVSLSTAAQAAPAQADRARASQGTQPTASPVRHRVHMGSYSAAKFAPDAAKLPAGLAVQLRKQLGITPEQFLAAGQAAADAGKVIAGLRAGGVTVYGAKLNGTALTLTVRDAAGVAAAQADGATAVIGTAQPHKTVKVKALSSPADGTSPLLGGDLWAYLTNSSAGEGVLCSTGFNGYDKSTGAREFLTAGHCADYQHTGDPAPETGIVYAAVDDTPLNLDTQLQPVWTPALGSLNQASFQFGGGADSGLVNVTDPQAKPAPAVTTWVAAAGGTANQGVENSGQVPVVGAAAAVEGAPVCHSGARTGWQCGTVNNGGYSYTQASIDTPTGIQTVDGFDTNVCDLPGDSGGSFVSGNYAVGVTSAGSFAPQADSGPGYHTCAPGGDTIAYPLIAAAAASGEQPGALTTQDFELAASVPVPVVSAATVDGGTGAGTIRGYLPRPFATGTRVSLTLDGHVMAPTTVDSNGNWSFSLTGLALGAHSYTVTAGSGRSTAATSKTLNVVPGTIASVKAPAVTGAVRTDARVVAYPGTWSVTGTTYTYQWLANGVRISGAVYNTYAVPAYQVGKKLSVTVTAHKSRYYNAARTSAALVVGKGVLILKVRPALSGTPVVGRRLTVTAGTWSPAAAVRFQWYANGVPVYRATGSSLLLPASLRGKVISVIVSASRTGYATAALRLSESVKVR